MGSGALKIGEAGEFDYSGSQAIKALKEEGIRVILVNPNIATIQTSKGLADEIYFFPVTPDFVEKIIQKEKPDGILLSFGGQTALNCGLSLHHTGVLSRYHVAVLGTPIEAIEATEDRRRFAEALTEAGLPVARGKTVTTVNEALHFGHKIGYPLMIRSGFALGGSGSGVVRSEHELKDKATKALANVPQIIVEESLYGWKEIEYEVVRDKDGNCITVCNMENFDPVGVHTGESIVIAPSQTLNDRQYYTLRQKSIDVISKLNIIGECNIQYALSPVNDEIRVIEVNARLSRSSALASKATGYPLAYVAAKLALGITLPELRNSITKKTSVFFEPSLDYIVVKMPRWDLDKFDGVENKIGSEMKSVGEVMGIARSFEEAIQKAARMLNIGDEGVVREMLLLLSTDELLARLKEPTTERLYLIVALLIKGVSVKRLSVLCAIDAWFIARLQHIADAYNELHSCHALTTPLLRHVKKLGFSDAQIANIRNTTPQRIRKYRLSHGIVPRVKHIDTMAGEFPAETNFLYFTYNASSSHYTPTKHKKNIVLGCGPYAIGTSVEFDWCAVNTVLTLREKGITSVMVNCNPETVSTDYDTSDILYFEELTLERVLDIYDTEKAPLIVSVGGQIANNLAPKLHAYGVPIKGTHPSDIYRAEYRETFSRLLDKLLIRQPSWERAGSLDEMYEKAKIIGYPLLLRPSFVLSGKAMRIIYTEEELYRFLSTLPQVLSSYSFVISKFLTGAHEYDVDAVADDGSLLYTVFSEHVEGGGVHSGDSTLITPPTNLSEEMKTLMREQVARIAHELHVNGVFNVQYLIHDEVPYVIECNLRASRTLPFVSKSGNFNMIRLATICMIGKALPDDMPKNTHNKRYFTVKVPQFSFQKLRGADPVTRVEMASTGEVAGFGTNVFRAYLKALLATGIKYPVHKKAFISIGGMKAKQQFFAYCQQLISEGYTLYTTAGTHQFLKEYGIDTTRLGKIHENIHPNVVEVINGEALDFVINTPEKQTEVTYTRYSKNITDGYLIRRAAIDKGIPVFTNIESARFFVTALLTVPISSVGVEPWSYYMNGEEHDK